MPIEQFRIERLDPAMCYVFWTLSRKALKCSLDFNQINRPPKKYSYLCTLKDEGRGSHNIAVSSPWQGEIQYAAASTAG